MTADLLSSLRQSLAGRYEIEAALGQGATALVFRARDLRHRRAVAIKVLDPALSLAVGSERFMREIEIAARLSHPHILPLLDSGVVALSGIGNRESGDPASTPDSPFPTHPTVSIPYYVMPLVEGESLRDRLEGAGPVPLADAIRLVQEVASALDYAHRQGVVHRDVKPANILLQDGHAVVADFGIARALGEAGGALLTRTGVTLGTPQYMSPEQITGDRPIDGRTDVYALGCVLYEMLAGKPPFAGPSVQAMVARRLAEPPPRLVTTGSGVPPAVDQAVRRALATDPDQRFAGPQEFSLALQGLAAPALRPPRLLWAGLLAIALLATLGTVLLLRQRGKAARPITTLAIRPLENQQDSTTLYLSEGIHEAVADLLRRLPQLSVTAPSFVAQVLKLRPDLDLQQLGQQLKVGAVLTWSMRRLGDSLHLRAELVSPKDGRILWGQTYDRPFRDLLAVQSDIARTISNSLRLQLTGQDLANLARSQTRDPEAWDLYLRGRHLYLRASILGGRTARQDVDSTRLLARQALALDPNFAGGHELLAAHYFISAFRGWVTPFAAYMDSSMAQARISIQLDSTFADAWADLAFPHFYLTDDWEEARRLVQRSIRLNPDVPQIHQFYGIFLAEVDRQFDSALAHIRRAVELDNVPFFLNTLGDVYMRARRYDSAIVALRRALELAPAVPGPRGRLVRSYERLGQYAEAIAVRQSGPDSLEAAELKHALTAEGAPGYRRVEARWIQRRIDSLLRVRAGPGDELRDTIPPLLEGRIATLYAQLGQWSKAMDWVLAEYQRRPRRFRMFVANPDFDSLRADPRFLALVRKEGLEALLRR